MTSLHDTEDVMLALWRDYLFLTKEMGKFLAKDDVDLFLELMEQRERLQVIIDKQSGHGFVLKPSESQIINDINRANHIIMDKLQYMLNNVNKQHTISQAYDGFSLSVGGRMDKHS